MKYLLCGDNYKRVFIEDDTNHNSFFYDMKEEKWVHGGSWLHDNRIGFDPSEPPDSMYRYGNPDCMEDIKEISKEEAEKFIGKTLDEEELMSLLKQ